MDQHGNIRYLDAINELRKKAAEGDATARAALHAMGEVVAIPDDQIARVQGMNRAQRLAWRSNQRRADRRARRAAARSKR